MVKLKCCLPRLNPIEVRMAGLLLSVVNTEHLTGCGGALQ